MSERTLIFTVRGLVVVGLAALGMGYWGEGGGWLILLAFLIMA